MLVDRQTNTLDIVYNYGGGEPLLDVHQPDPDKPALVSFEVSSPLKARSYYSLHLFAISGEITSEVDTRLQDLKTAPTGDAYLTLKQALDLLPAPPTIELLQRGVLFCTSEPLQTYRATEGHFTVIEKTKRTYKTR